ncbi:Carbonic anhydrase or acetyltransferase, isoleucine patch superfamily [Peptoclostridium litorale DSM 5388]|uniref:Carbonic anhydrase/acetyltransferase, isoleucine patch superfamily n=1 Tax=Peptoclostridium litorale DSM 5388 TaxID=1121324 RepID=A0A069RPJ5_PEPLI|nr:gamma carbonic anhydrase family protein [Peptoclostridium litorale]KDR96087.1 carbonic anhydrase/acetyltransferase, isoleucine patch superfamily [Peptoclostridium litorale DSM 5388]SIO04959.1 Carbonic anhydrase or acetyltransferase, isoleucine patch superfamily [Peptoclostridium litorale DSM 5388]
MIKGYENYFPQLPDSCFIAQSADIIGRVILGENTNVWYNCVLRGDEEEIVIGDNTNIQDGTVVHIGRERKTIVGNYVTIGYRAIIHGCEIGNYSLIGMGAIVLDGASIGEYTIIGAGSLVPPGKKIPAGVLAYGNPVRIIRELSDDEKNSLKKTAVEYIEFAQKHK